MSIATDAADRAFIREHLARYGFSAATPQAIGDRPPQRVPELVTAIVAILREDRRRRGRDSENDEKRQ